ncbi:hypothetical protein Tco_0082382 [Tanacetum coccineum]
MIAKDKTGLGYGTHLNEMSNNFETDSEISLSVFDVRSSDEESTPVNDMLSKADRYHVVPPPITGNFLTPRANISFVGKTNKANTQKSKTIYESVNRDKVIIEDWNLDDEDDVSKHLDRKSTTGGCQFLGRRLISWECKKQIIMENSTIEAEYVAAANCCG